MAGITKQKYNRIQEVAMEIVASYGISKLDCIVNSKIHYGIIGGWAFQLIARYGITKTTARMHILCACNRQRFPKQKQLDGWGGKRDGAGISS